MFNAPSALTSAQETFKITNTTCLLSKTEFQNIWFYNEQSKNCCNCIASCPDPGETESPKTSSYVVQCFPLNLNLHITVVFQFNSNLLTSMFLTILLKVALRMLDKLQAMTEKSATQILRMHSIAFVAARLDFYKPQLKLQHIPSTITACDSCGEEQSAFLLQPMVAE